MRSIDWDQAKAFITALSNSSIPTYFIKPTSSMWLTTSALISVITTSIGTGAAAGAEATAVAQALVTSAAASIKNTITSSYLNPNTIITSLKNITSAKQW